MLEERRQAFRARRDYLVPALRELGFGIPVMPGGGFFVYADCSRFSRDSLAFCRDVLEATGVAITPGHRLRQPPGARARALRLHDRDGEARGRRGPSRAPSAVAAAIAVTGRALRAAMAALASLPLLAACGYPEFLWQGAVGQVELIAGARPIDDVLAATDDPKLALRLARAREIRAFASRELALPDNRSYLRYTDVGRPFVVWNVFAAPPLSLEPRQLVLPGGGLRQLSRLLPRGGRARRKPRASRRRATTSTSAACRRTRRSAGSTIRCSRRSSAIRTPRSRGSCSTSSRTRSCTSRTTRRSTRHSPPRSRRRASRAGSPRRPGRRGHAALVAEAARGKRLREGFRQWMREARAELEALYASGASDAEQRARKAAVFERMRAAYEAAKAGESGLAGYDRWFAGHDGQRAEQREHRRRRALRRQGARVPGVARAGRRRPAGVLRARARARREAEGGARCDPRCTGGQAVTVDSAARR